MDKKLLKESLSLHPKIGCKITGNNFNYIFNNDITMWYCGTSKCRKVYSF